MSIRKRIEDAEHLWAAGRKEGAWCQALIAAAATSRLRYPKPMSDNKAFKSYICDIATVIMSGEVPADGKIVGPTYFRFTSDDASDGERKLEDVFYVELRCNLFHEGALKEIGFSESMLNDDGDTLSGELSVPPTGRATIPDFYVLNLIKAIKAAPENAAEFHAQ